MPVPSIWGHHRQSTDELQPLDNPRPDTEIPVPESSTFQQMPNQQRWLSCIASEIPWIKPYGLALISQETGRCFSYMPPSALLVLHQCFDKIHQIYLIVKDSFFMPSKG
jgi:hypothetical protein